MVTTGTLHIIRSGTVGVDGDLPLGPRPDRDPARRARDRARTIAWPPTDRRIIVAVHGPLRRGELRAEHGAVTTTAHEVVAEIRGWIKGRVLAPGKDEGPARVREAYPQPTWDRLVSVKRIVDPTNLFRLDQNIPPEV
jgi:hypothetical protein